MGRVAGENVGNYAFTLGTLTAGSNYTLSIAATPEFSITSKAILITPDAGQTKVFGQADPTPFTYTFAPALGGSDAITGLMGRVAGEDVNTYAFTLGTLTAGRKLHINNSSNSDLQHHTESNPYHTGCRSDQGLWPG